MSVDLVLASGNAGKLVELRELLGGAGWNLRAQSEFGVEDVEETGLTFVENALLKARHAARATGLPALADDSGLCVDALGGAPGLYSARYAGPAASDQQNNTRLLDDLPEDALALELQRSLDYYERQMHQTPPSAVYICGTNVSEDKVGQVLRSSLAVPVQFLDPASALGLPEPADGALLQTCLAALGGFLRKEQVA